MSQSSPSLNQSCGVRGPSRASVRGGKAFLDEAHRRCRGPGCVPPQLPRGEDFKVLTFSLPSARGTLVIRYSARHRPLHRRGRILYAVQVQDPLGCTGSWYSIYGLSGEVPAGISGALGDGAGIEKALMNGLRGVILPILRPRCSFLRPCLSLDGNQASSQTLH